MSVLPTSRVSRRLLKIASLGLAGLLAGLLTGCSSTTEARLTHPHLDTDWQTSSTYASATAAMSSQASAFSSHAAHAIRIRPCYSALCKPELAGNRMHTASRHHTM